jgi:acyl carrier protein
MTREEIVAQVNTVMSNGFEISKDKLRPEANLFTDLGLDSLDAVDMVVHLEDKFSVKVDGERVQKVRTMADVYDLVHEIEKEKNGSGRQS